MAGIGDIAKNLEDVFGGKLRVAVETLGADGKKVHTTVQLTSLVKGAFDATRELASIGEVVSLPGFGNFRVMDRKATKARNPQTGAQFDVAASKRMKFTASKSLKAGLNGGATAAPVVETPVVETPTV